MHELPPKANGVHVATAPRDSGLTVNGPIVGGPLRLYPGECALFAGNFAGRWVLVDRSSWKPGRKNADQLLKWLEDRLENEDILLVSYRAERWSGGEMNYAISLGTDQGRFEGTTTSSLEEALRDLYENWTRDTQPHPSSTE